MVVEVEEEEHVKLIVVLTELPLVVEVVEVLDFLVVQVVLVEIE
jgi:hypothetical protein